MLFFQHAKTTVGIYACNDTLIYMCCAAVLIPYFVSIGQFNILDFVQINVEGDELKPATLGTSQGLHVGQSCLSIGNPYGYANTLTTGVTFIFGLKVRLC